jgi:hypothetical protein
MIRVTELRTRGGSSSPNAKVALIERPPHPREVKLGLRDSAGALEHDCILSIAGDFANELVQLFRRARTGTGALARVATVGGNLPFARHG